MRKLAATLSLIFCVSLFLLAQSPNDKGLLEKAKALYEQEDFTASVETLLRIEAKTGEVIYWLWKNERKIGNLASSPGAQDEAHPLFKYYEYVQSHPKYLTRNAAMGNTYTPTRRRYEEIANLFPESDSAGSILFERTEDYVYPRLSEDGLDEEGRVYLITQYQMFINRFPRHTYSERARKRIELFEEPPEARYRRLGLPFIFDRPSMVRRYERKFNIDQELYKSYLEQWLKSGPYREFGIEVLVGRRNWMRFLNRFDIPKNTKESLLALLRSGKLVLFSEAAYRNKEWQGPKVVVFDPKAN